VYVVTQLVSGRNAEDTPVLLY